MPITIVNKTALDVRVDVDDSPRAQSLPAAAVAGNAILVCVSGWNFDEAGEIIASVTDDGSNTYARIGTISNGARGRAEAWIAANVAEATTITVTPSVDNSSNRYTWQAIQLGGIAASPLDQVASATSGLTSTTCTATTATTTSDDQAVFALLGTLWPNSPKGHAAASGYTTVDSHADTSTTANSMGYLLSWKTVASAGAQSAVWTYNSQSQGAQGLLFTLKAGAAAGARVRIEGKDPQAIGATSCLVEFYHPPANPAERILGEYVWTKTGYTMIDDGTGKAGALIDLPEYADVTIGQSVMAIVRGLTGGQSWGSHRWVGTVEASNFDPTTSLYVGSNQIQFNSATSAYRSYFDSQASAQLATITALAGNRNDTEGQSYYMTHYCLPFLQMFIATGAVSYLSTAYDLIEASIADADVEDNSGYLNWPGLGANALNPYTPDGPQSETLLFSVQAGSVFAQAAALGLLNQSLVGPTMAARAQAIFDFTKVHICDKWYVAREFGDPLVSQELRLLDLSNNSGGKDRPALAGVMMMALNAVVADSQRATWIDRIMEGFKDRLTASSSGQYMDPDPDTAQLDTGHSNRWAYLAVASRMWGAPNAATAAQVEDMGDHFAAEIYNGDPDDVQFAANQDGTGTPSANSATYLGWHWLGMDSANCLAVTQATADAVIAGQNPTGNTVWVSKGSFCASYLMSYVLQQVP